LRLILSNEHVDFGKPSNYYTLKQLSEERFLDTWGKIASNLLLRLPVSDEAGAMAWYI
jgi:hypothetical protein